MCNDFHTCIFAAPPIVRYGLVSTLKTSEEPLQYGGSHDWSNVSPWGLYCASSYIATSRMPCFTLPFEVRWDLEDFECVLKERGIVRVFALPVADAIAPGEGMQMMEWAVHSCSGGLNY